MVYEFVSSLKRWPMFKKRKEKKKSTFGGGAHNLRRLGIIENNISYSPLSILNSLFKNSAA